MVAMPVEGVAFYFTDYKDGKNKDGFPLSVVHDRGFLRCNFVAPGDIARQPKILTIMTIKGANGESYSVTGQGQGVLNTVLGATAIGNQLLTGSGIFSGLLGGGGNRPVEVITSEDKPISRYEAKMMQEAAAKDSKIALLESQVYVDGKLKETIEYLLGETRKVENEVRKNKDEQNAINMEQAVYNGTNTAAVACLKGQVAQLQALTELVVPQRRVCDTGCCCNNQ